MQTKFRLLHFVAHKGKPEIFEHVQKSANYKSRHTTDFPVNRVTAVLMSCHFPMYQLQTYFRQRSTTSSGSSGKGIIASGFGGCDAIHFSIQIMSYQRSNLYAQA